MKKVNKFNLKPNKLWVDKDYKKLMEQWTHIMKAIQQSLKCL